jgi:hypothetical protein
LARLLQLPATQKHSARRALASLTNSPHHSFVGSGRQKRDSIL